MFNVSFAKNPVLINLKGKSYFITYCLKDVKDFSLNNYIFHNYNYTILLKILFSFLIPILNSFLKLENCLSCLQQQGNKFTNKSQLLQKPYINVIWLLLDNLFKICSNLQ